MQKIIISKKNEKDCLGIINQEVEKMAKILEIPMPVISITEGEPIAQVVNGQLQITINRNTELVNMIGYIACMCRCYFMLGYGIYEQCNSDFVLYNCASFAAGYIVIMLEGTNLEITFPDCIGKDLKEKILQETKALKIAADIFGLDYNLIESWISAVRAQNNEMIKELKAKPWNHNLNAKNF